MAWDITWAEITRFVGNGFLQIFGTPILIGFFLMIAIFWWTKDIKIVIQSMFVMMAVGIILLVNAGYLPGWLLFITLIIVATLVGVVVMTWLS
ncbi:hypothetical protein DRO91_05595 [Candidatus Heimdallarchaeota archaeon]|nr:MAG: hypothetical protein DRO91_05595 [Candidatus Heimdallarchaeota archaeon]